VYGRSPPGRGERGRSLPARGA